MPTSLTPNFISDLQAPMELLGGHRGINIIDPTTALTRLWYFDGKFLRASGFRLDQEYVRSLVALSNQALGHGVSYGFDVVRGSGDTLDIAGGLALAPTGRVVYMPSTASVSIAELIARSSGQFSPSNVPARGSADFALCPPDDPDSPDTPVTPSAFYVLTVAAADALCGEEEKFGQLCEDACASESDRSVAVDGVCFRVRSLQLTLPTSQAVPFSGLHVRSQVASAYFEAERQAVASRISGAGLQSAVWCAGAPGVGGDEIPIAVFNRSGSTTTWLDMWTARRELMETNPQRYWGWRFAMRPLDVFLAQVLQFQCQLLSLGTDGPGLEPDPCADERFALAEANQVLQALVESQTPTTDFTLAIPALAQARIAELSELIQNTLTGNIPSASGSALIDGGVIELPSGGYLPVDPNGDIEGQVRAFMGPGVDLRFCAVRADFIPEALQEAQHMERISLTAGIDDPDELEEVDILVPGGRFETQAGATSAYEGFVRYLPDDDDDDGPAAAITMRTVAREHVGETWSWTLAGATEARPGIGRDDLAAPVDAVFNRDLSTAVNAVDGAARLRERETEFMARLGPERARRAFTSNRFRARAGLRGRAAAADRGLAFSGWLDVQFQTDLRFTTVGQRVGVRIDASLHAETGDIEALRDFRFRGDVVVIDHQGAAAGSTIVRTRFDGVLDRFSVDQGEPAEQNNETINDLFADWQLVASSTGGPSLEQVTIIARRGIRDDQVATLDLRQLRGPQRVTAELRADRSSDVAQLNVTLADALLTESPGALDAGSFGHDLGNGVLDVIGLAMIASDRDANWRTAAQQRLFAAGDPVQSTAISTDGDWVMFHRRRVKVCGDERVTRPTVTRRYRWYHVDLPETDVGPDIDFGSAFLGRLTENPALLSRLDFRQISTLTFDEGETALTSSAATLRSDWSARVTSDELVVGAVADPPTGDGAAVALGRMSSGLAAIQNLIDISAMPPPTVLNEIPPEFQTPGTDGVILTAGRQSDSGPVETVCATVVRVPLQVINRIDQVNSPDVNIASLLDEFGIPDDDFLTVFWEGDDLLAADEVNDWWFSVNPDVVASVSRFDFSENFLAAADAAERQQWLQVRLPQIMEVVGPAPLPTQLSNLIWDGDCDVILLLARESFE